MPTNSEWDPSMIKKMRPDKPAPHDCSTAHLYNQFQMIREKIALLEDRLARAGTNPPNRWNLLALEGGGASWFYFITYSRVQCDDSTCRIAHFAWSGPRTVFIGCLFPVQTLLVAKPDCWAIEDGGRR